MESHWWGGGGLFLMKYLNPKEWLQMIGKSTVHYEPLAVN
jgi:hypothetical protein